MFIYNKYSEYLKEKYGEKVYKLPINLPITCPNRIDAKGCNFCAEVGTGFESMSADNSVTNQLLRTKEYIGKRYGANKFIAYFQNYTNTFMPIELFEAYIHEAAQVDDIVEISISTRPDCIHTSYLEVLDKVSKKYSISITIELGLQSGNNETLRKINRGHGIVEYIDAMQMIRSYSFTTCTHVILNLPYDSISDTIETAKLVSVMKSDIVKLHSLYIAKHSTMANEYESGLISICSKDEYLERLAIFLQYISDTMIVERLFSRIPKDDMFFSNWGMSWWKLQDEFLEKMEQEERYQGQLFNYLNGSALRKL